MWYAQLDASGIFSCCYLWITFYQDFVVAVVVVSVVVIKCFMIGVTVWWVYLAPQNIPRAISVLTLGNKVILYCISLSWLVMNFVDVCIPFTVRACKISGLKSAHIHACKQCIWWSYNISFFTTVHFHDCVEHHSSTTKKCGWQRNKSKKGKS